MLLLGLLANINMFGVVPAHQRLIFDVGTVLVYIPLLICAGFVYSDCTGRCKTIHTVNMAGYSPRATMALTTSKQTWPSYMSPLGW